MVGRVKVTTASFRSWKIKFSWLKLPLSLAQRSSGRGAVAVLDGGERGPVAVVLLADLAVVGGRADRGALLSLHGGAGDLGDLVTDLSGDVSALLPLHLVTHLGDRLAVRSLPAQLRLSFSHLLGFLLADLSRNLTAGLSWHLLTLLLGFLSRHVSEEENVIGRK